MIGSPTSAVLPTASLTPVASNWSFITRNGFKLYDGQKQYRFVSLNTADFFMLQDRPSTYYFRIPPDPWEQNDAASTLAGFRAQATRSYTLGFAKGQHVPALRTYNEAAFVGMDNALAAAKRFGIRVIIPLVNDHKGDDSSTDWFYGDYGLFASFRNKKPSQFYTDPLLIEDFKHLLSFLLNRVNTVNGVVYV